MNIEEFPYPICFNTVDIIPMTSFGVFLARKPDEKQYRMVGGFMNPGEIRVDSAAREFEEETGRPVNTSDLFLFGEYAVDDHRYKNSKHGITTTVFYFYLNDKNLTPKDDICEIKFFTLNFLKENLNDMIVPEHRKILEQFVDKKMNEIG
jgi:ADP-ribose pyrophosphatase YjhB (NUDIX family)